MDSMKKFLKCYEQLRECEKRMVVDGYPEKLLNRGKKIYGPLIKVFATRSEATEFKARRPSLFAKERPLSPVIVPKKILMRDREIQTDPYIR